MIREQMLIIPFILAFTISGCNHDYFANTIEVVNLESGLNAPTQISLSQYAADVSYLCLEMDDNLPLKGVYTFDSHDSLMLISDPQGFFLYTTSGGLLSIVGRIGRGPGEYTYGLNGRIGENLNIYINDGRGLVEYNYRGEFLSRYQVFSNPEIFKWAPTAWTMICDSLIFVHIRNNSGREEFKAFMIDKDGAIHRRFKNHIFYEGRAGTQSSFARLYSINGQVTFLESFNDTLFRLGINMELDPAYVFHWGKYFISPNEYWSRFALSTLQERQWARANDLFETRDFIFIDVLSYMTIMKRTVPVSIPGVSSTLYTTRILGVYDKNTRKLAIAEITRTDEKLQITGLFNDIDGGPKFFPRFRMGDDRLVMPIDAYELKSYIKSDSFKNASALRPEKKKALEDLANSLSVDDNPVLMVVTLK